MPRRRWIEKNEGQTFQLLYRSQDDPLIHDDLAGDRALFPTQGQADTVVSSSSQSDAQEKGLHIADLEHDVDLQSMRDNEGEAAEHGIYFDDTKYDYMQHLRDLGEGGGDAQFVDAMSIKEKGKGKGKAMKLEDALRLVSMDDDMQSTQEGSILDDDYSTFSAAVKDRQLERQQDIPDEIAGFQPGMDPRLREVLEALDDDAYVDEEDDDVFAQLGKSGNTGELSLDEFEMSIAEDDDGWESDATERAPSQPTQLPIPTSNDINGPDVSALTAQDGDWLAEFAKHKRSQPSKPLAPQADASSIVASSTQDKAPTLYTLNGTPLRQKKRKGAQTNPSAYSMTSSSLVRTEGQQLLDARFDKVEQLYALNEEDEFDAEADGSASMISGMTGVSKSSQLSTSTFGDQGAVRGDFDSMMDGFLGDFDKSNRGSDWKRTGAKGKRGKNGNEVFGLRELDEVRRELGPARIRRRSQKAQ